MALRHVDVTIARVGHDVRRVGQGFGRVSPHARLPQRHQDFPFGTEPDDNASLLVFSGKLLEVLLARGSCVGHPPISLSIHMHSMPPHEPPPAKSPALLTQ